MPVSPNPHLKELSHEDLFRKIGDICNAVAVSLKGCDLLELSLKKTMELFGAQRGSIFILDSSSKELVLKIAQGMEVSEKEHLIKKMGEGVIGRVAQSKQPLVVEDIAADSRFEGYKARKKYSTPSFICAPLLIKDELIGVISLSDKETGERFSESELQLLDVLSSQIALNYRRIQLFEKFKTIVKESKGLKDELGKKSEDAARLKKQVVLQERLASIGKLTAGIAHELNNPLDGVLRYVNLSLDHIKDDDVVRGYLMEVKQGLNRMADVIRNLLACSRQAPPTMQKRNVNNAIQDAVRSLKGDLRLKNIRVETDFANDLPDILDFGIETVASNLIRNSVDSVEPEGLIRIKTRCSDQEIVLEFSDNGRGIPPDVINEIFEPFYTTKEIDKGCGLGLTIVNEIVKMYTGKINVVSAPNQGASFSVTLPVLSAYA
ncbi:MAG TPA: ATP-binding protein [Candidatus Omnitrophota bacterium]|nr:ATP-binding protein [Candidatus Omnitrophota bacterium]HPD85205.1 ATP-binding protein [Candidatus Omnitrophota bacterium]HRZ04294.1 ATP-binding protein [Candidatus Omnitrophota bacterium]